MVLAPSWAPSWARNVPAMALAPVVDPLAPDVSTQLAPAPKRRQVAKNHDCEHCAKRFNSASALAQHVRVHTNEKPFACTRPACGKCFSQEANLRVHVDWHNGVKHPCATCPLVFDNRSNLLKHLRTAEACGGKKTAPCEVCGGAGFCSPYELKRHFKTSTHKKRKAAQAFSSCE
ncbi:hypothetical protein T484DRAFT_2797083 [Baffinella frigidus]|nr:hypothetical protein T484DRAFT_2797083 [Cryptophyta sp. CCMP2293]